MSRFYVSPGSVLKDKVVIRGKEAHHARDVMRLKAGDKIVVFDGTGKEYAGVIERAGKEELVARIDKVTERPADNCRITLVQAVPKLNKMDLIVEKATELGVFKVMPVITDRTMVKPGIGEANPKLERWKKLAVVAAKQCGRATVPEISEVTKFKDSLDAISGNELSLIPCLCGGTIALRSVIKDKKPKSVAVFIGPEGDFTPDEVAAAKSKGAIPVLLGPEVLRSDTAAVSVLSIINYELRW